MRENSGENEGGTAERRREGARTNPMEGFMEGPMEVGGAKDWGGRKGEAGGSRRSSRSSWEEMSVRIGLACASLGRDEVGMRWG
jgi:hypothetical protein